LLKEIQEIISAAIKKRSELLTLESFRVFDGFGDGREGLFIDKFGPVLLVHIFGECSERYPELIHFWSKPSDTVLDELKIRSVYLRVHSRSPRTSDARGAKLLFGPEASKVILSEGALELLVKPTEDVNAGLFLDMRDVRRKLTARSAGAQVLNLFCFTGSLGVAAFTGGAKEVVQVDVSKGALSWANENLRLNQSKGTGEMRFIPEDALTFVKREARRIEKGRSPYDLVIIDPPTFGTSEKGAFSFKKDIGTLLNSVAHVVHERSQLILTTNNRELSPQEIEELARNSFAKNASVEILLPPQPDFPAQGADSISMRGIWMEFER
jgi:23S rRNA (cytosine1962-C5)-methyltransferase